MNQIELTKDNFDAALTEHKLMVVDFWAPWCKPCLAFKKVVDEVSGEYPDVMFAAIDVDQETELAKEFEIRSVPSIMILRDQVVVYAEAGAMPATGLRELLNQAKALSQEQLQALKEGE